MLSGMAALVRQWLDDGRGHTYETEHTKRQRDAVGHRERGRYAEHRPQAAGADQQRQQE